MWGLLRDNIDWPCKVHNFWKLRPRLFRLYCMGGRHLKSFLQFREKKEKPEIPFTSFERKKRNLKEYSQFSRGERKMDFLFSSFKTKKRNYINFSLFEKRKRNFKCCSPILRREREMCLKKGFRFWLAVVLFWHQNIWQNLTTWQISTTTQTLKKCIFLSKIWSISQRKRNRNKEQNLINRG